MGKVYLASKCDICGVEGKVIETWGRYFCKACYDKQPKKGSGNSGMVPFPYFTYQTNIFSSSQLSLELIPKGDKAFATLYLTHYPNSKGIVGRQCNYLVKQGVAILGIIGANSPPLNYKKFNAYFGKQFTELNWLNNNVFRLIVHDKNLGTKVLKLFRHTIKRDYESRYGDKLIGLITFVEPPRTGAVYKADNWDYLGLTEGKHCSRRGDHGKWINKEWSNGTVKEIFAKWIIKK